jgi:hypothetical protein
VCPVCGILLVLFLCESKRDLLSHFQKRKVCLVYFDSFRGIIVDDFFDGSNSITRGTLFEVYFGPIRTGLNSELLLVTIMKGKIIFYEEKVRSSRHQKEQNSVSVICKRDAHCFSRTQDFIKFIYHKQNGANLGRVV